jgi:hypothetical protein
LIEIEIRLNELGYENKQDIAENWIPLCELFRFFIICFFFRFKPPQTHTQQDKDQPDGNAGQLCPIETRVRTDPDQVSGQRTKRDNHPKDDGN